MRAMQGATAVRLRLALGAVTLMLAGLVFVKAIVPVLAEAQSTTTATVTGVVYSDRNGDGRQQPRERGIPGVHVSDGATATSTRSPSASSPDGGHNRREQGRGRAAPPPAPAQTNSRSAALPPPTSGSLRRHDTRRMMSMVRNPRI